MTSIAVGLQTAGLDHDVRLQTGPCDEEPFPPMTLRRTQVFPILTPKLIEDDRIEAELSGHVEDAFVSHDAAGVPHSAAVGNRDRARPAFPKPFDQASKDIVVG